MAELIGGNLLSGGAAPTGGAEGGGVSGGDVSGGSVGDPGGRKYPGWTEHLPGDLKKPEVLDQLAGFEHLGDAIKGFLDSKGKLEKAIFVPAEGASADEVARFRESLGVPKSPGEYGLKEIADVPKLDREPGFEEWLAEVAHGANLSKGQTEVLYRKFLGRAKQGIDEQAAKHKATVEKVTLELKNELKEKFDPTVKRCREIVSKVGGDEFASFLDESGLSNDPRMVRFLAKIQDQFADDTLPNSGIGGFKPKNDNPRDPANWDFKL